MTISRTATLLAAACAVSGCVSTAAKIVTAPVKAAGKTVDLMTTSQSEADEKRGREMRRNEQRLGELDREYDKHMRRCSDGDQAECLRARDTYAEMQALAARMSYTVPER